MDIYSMAFQRCADCAASSLSRAGWLGTGLGCGMIFNGLACVWHSLVLSDYLTILLQNLTKVSHLSHIASAHKCYILCTSFLP